MKRFLSMVLIFALFLSMGTHAAATTDPAGQASEGLLLIDNYTFIDESGNIQHFCTECPQPLHFNLILHTHSVTDMSGPSRYSTYGGILAETEYPADSDGTLSGSLTKTVSNSYSVTIGFSESTISSSVGFNVTRTQSSTASYSAQILKGQMGTLHYYDVYNRTDFTAVTNYYTVEDGVAIFMYSETGPGYALEWSHFSYDDEVYYP